MGGNFDKNIVSFCPKLYNTLKTLVLIAFMLYIKKGSGVKPDVVLPDQTLETIKPN